MGHQTGRGRPEGSQTSPALGCRTELTWVPVLHTCGQGLSQLVPTGPIRPYLVFPMRFPETLSIK